LYEIVALACYFSVSPEKLAFGDPMEQKTLYLVRGLPGSGKTTIAKQIAPVLNVAADDYFVDDDGNYNFDPKLLGSAHAYCKSKAEAWMTRGHSPIAVHNTFSEAWEAKDYMNLADSLGYSIFVIECQSSFGNTHDVPEAGIQKMRDRWEPICHSKSATLSLGVAEPPCEQANTSENTKAG
jgi:hypothetical protein